MDIRTVLNGKYDCTCGKEHPCDILYAKDLKDRYTILWRSFALGIDCVDL